MHQTSLKNWCKVLRNKGYTLGEIVKATNKPKTTVYFHIKNIPRTKLCSEKIRMMNIRKIKNLGPKKGRSVLGYSYKKFKRWTPSLVNLVAHMTFDGAIRREGVLYYNRNISLIKNFKDRMAEIYNGEPKIYSSNNGVVRLAYHNVELVNFFKKKVVILLKNIKKLPLSHRHEFLRAFFDDKGSVDFRLSEMKRRIKGYQHNRRVLLLINQLLKNFKISSSIDYNFHEILITKKKNINTFAQKINFSSGVRINGKRSNSIWKKSLEKREILTSLLASYH